MVKINIDAFGREVNVGDYVAFTTKGQQSGVVQLGIVTKFSDRRVSLNSICTYGMTIEAYLEYKEKTRKSMLEQYERWKAEEDATGEPMSAWKRRYKEPLPLFDTTSLHSLSSAVLIEPIGLPPGVQQILKV